MGWLFHRRLNCLLHLSCIENLVVCQKVIPDKKKTPPDDRVGLGKVYKTS